jgi:serine protease Do
LNQFRFDSHDPFNKSPLIVTALISGVIAAFLMLVAIKFSGLGVMLTTPSAPVPTPLINYNSASTTINEYEKAVIDVYNRVKPSVVMITTDTLVEEFDFFNGSSLQNIQGLGSGVVFRSDGYLLTNRHVVAGVQGRKVSQISVVLSNGKSYPAKIIGVDSPTDLAVLRIDDHQLEAPVWGDSESVQVGQTAIAIGNPLTESLQNTVTVGVVSATGRAVVLDEQYNLQMIQTDASINPGNSGGPLLDSSGHIIGINTVIAAKSQGIGFSIPSNTVKSVANQLIEKGYVSRPGLGIVYIQFVPQNVTILEARLRRDFPVKSGLFIGKLIAGSSADRAGIVPGDIIYSVNDQAVKNMDLIRDAVANHPIGTKLKLGVYRGKKRLEINVKIGEMKQKEEI